MSQLHAIISAQCVGGHCAVGWGFVPLAVCPHQRRRLTRCHAAWLNVPQAYSQLYYSKGPAEVPEAPKMH